jgi:hypothetical protein
MFKPKTSYEYSLDALNTLISTSDTINLFDFIESYHEKHTSFDIIKISYYNPTDGASKTYINDVSSLTNTYYSGKVHIGNKNMTKYKKIISK